MTKASHLSQFRESAGSPRARHVMVQSILVQAVVLHHQVVLVCSDLNIYEGDSKWNIQNSNNNVRSHLLL